jgi:hypothetical protein
VSKPNYLLIFLVLGENSWLEPSGQHMHGIFMDAGIHGQWLEAGLSSPVGKTAGNYDICMMHMAGTSPSGLARDI